MAEATAYGRRYGYHQVSRRQLRTKISGGEASVYGEQAARAMEPVLSL